MLGETLIKRTWNFNRMKCNLENMIRAKKWVQACEFSLCHCSNYHVCQNKRALRETQIKTSDCDGPTYAESVFGEKLLSVISKVTKTYYVCLLD